MFDDVVRALAGTSAELRERYLARIRESDVDEARALERQVLDQMNGRPANRRSPSR